MNRNTTKITFIVIMLALMAMTAIVSAADDGSVDSMEALKLFLIPVLSTGAYGALMYYKNTQQTGEPFEWAKFQPTLIIGLAASVFLYITGATEISTFTVNALLVDWIPILGSMGVFTYLGTTGVFAAVFGVLDKFIKNRLNPATTEETTTTTTTTTTAPVTSATPATLATNTPSTDTSSWNPDFSVLPAAIKVKSGTPVTFTLQTVSPGTGADTGIHKCKEVIVDWMDGTPLQPVQMGDGIVQVPHAYDYAAGESQYDSHQFYPEFTTIDAYDGSKKTFNTEGRSCAIEVVSLIPAKPTPK